MRERTNLGDEGPYGSINVQLLNGTADGVLILTLGKVGSTGQLRKSLYCAVITRGFSNQPGYGRNIDGRTDCPRISPVFCYSVIVVLFCVASG